MGDYYLNKVSGDLFGPKATGGWGDPINLKGTANVIASTWISWEQWFYTGVVYLRQAEYYIPDPILAAIGYTNLRNMLESGGVMIVYVKLGNASRPLPYTDYVGNWHASWHYYPIPDYLNYFVFEVRTHNGTTALPTVITNPAGDKQIRYVLIPAGVQLPGAASSLRTQADWSKMGYAEVKDILNLQD